MPEKLKFYDLRRSPNNVKVRIALNYKGLAYETVPVPITSFPPPPQDRAEVIRVSGQPLTPVLVHGDRAVFDSAAILRYLDANFRDSPPLFSTDRGTMQEIERWEWFARGDLTGPVGICFHQAFADKVDSIEIQRACEQLNELAGRIEKQLEKTEWLVGHRMTAADVTAAPVVCLGMLPKELGQEGPIVKFFVDNLDLGADRARTRAWVQKVMEFDR